MFILVYGNPVDGLQFKGPFDNIENAHSIAERELRNEDWWVAPLDSH